MIINLLRDGEDAALKALLKVISKNPAIVPTDTVYGLVCDGRSDNAKKEIYTLKGRPQTKFLIGFIKDIRTAEKFARIQPEHRLFVEKRWPGRHTFIFPAACHLNFLTGTDNTIALRVPDFPLLARLLEHVEILASTSANFSGCRSPASMEEIPEQIRTHVGTVIDSGVVPGRESAIWDMTEPIVRLVRGTVLFVCSGNSCRSPMAQMYLERLLGKRSKIKVCSAGLAASGLSAPARETRIVLAEDGVDISSFVVRRLTPAAAHDADLIFTMEATYRDKLLKEFPGSEDRIISLGVPDPFGRDISYYRQTRDIIKQLIETVVKPRIKI